MSEVLNPLLYPLQVSYCVETQSCAQVLIIYLSILD